MVKLRDVSAHSGDSRRDPKLSRREYAEAPFVDDNGWSYPNTEHWLRNPASQALF
jgi:hypothetical protein